MLEILNKAFDEMINRYERILKFYYPAHKCAGFTERNLTNNFASSLERIIDPCVPWFEAPVGPEYKERIDAIVFFPNIKTSLLIESKRFSNPSGKLKELKNDIKKIANPENQKILEKEIKGFGIAKRYGVILADVWTEIEPKIKIFRSWKKIIEDYAQAIPVKVLSTPQREAKDHPDDSTWPGKYQLLMAVIDLTNC
jgi:hypothetical protein